METLEKNESMENGSISGTPENDKVKAICPSCGAELEVDPGSEAAICPSCGAPFVVEKGIRLYQKQNPPPLSEEAIRLRKEADALYMSNAAREKQVLRLFWKILAGLVIAAGILFAVIISKGMHL